MSATMSMRQKLERRECTAALAGALLVSLLLAPAVTSAASCTVSAPVLAFGTYDPLSATNLDSSNVVTVTCVWSAGGGGGTQNVTPVISLNAGLPPGTYAQRLLRTIAGDTLNYNLYRNAARTTIFGNGTGGTVTGGTAPTTLSLPNSGAPRTGTRTVFGRIPAGQSTAVPGSYSDTITVTVTY
jgi:spore coat protein U-like protein